MNNVSFVSSVTAERSKGRVWFMALIVTVEGKRRTLKKEGINSSWPPAQALGRGNHGETCCIIWWPYE